MKWGVGVVVVDFLMVVVIQKNCLQRVIRVTGIFHLNIFEVVQISYIETSQL